MAVITSVWKEPFISNIFFPQMVLYIEMNTWFLILYIISPLPSQRNTFKALFSASQWFILHDLQFLYSNVLVKLY